MADGHYNVLFLSSRNAARSIFAEAVLNRMGMDTLSALVRGCVPPATSTSWQSMY